MPHNEQQDEETRNQSEVPSLEEQVKENQKFLEDDFRQQVRTNDEGALDENTTIAELAREFLFDIAKEMARLAKQPEEKNREFKQLLSITNAAASAGLKAVNGLNQTTQTSEFEKNILPFLTEIMRTKKAAEDIIANEENVIDTSSTYEDRMKLVRELLDTCLTQIQRMTYHADRICIALGVSPRTDWAEMEKNVSYTKLNEEPDMEEESKAQQTEKPVTEEQPKEKETGKTFTEEQPKEKETGKTFTEEQPKEQETGKTVTEEQSKAQQTGKTVTEEQSKAQQDEDSYMDDIFDMDFDNKAGSKENAGSEIHNNENQGAGDDEKPITEEQSKEPQKENFDMDGSLEYNNDIEDHSHDDSFDMDFDNEAEPKENTGSESHTNENPSAGDDEKIEKNEDFENQNKEQEEQQEKEQENQQEQQSDPDEIKVNEPIAPNLKFADCVQDAINTYVEGKEAFHEIKEKISKYYGEMLNLNMEVEFDNAGKVLDNEIIKAGKLLENSQTQEAGKTLEYSKIERQCDATIQDGLDNLEILYYDDANRSPEKAHEQAMQCAQASLDLLYVETTERIAAIRNAARAYLDQHPSEDMKNPKLQKLAKAIFDDCSDYLIGRGMNVQVKHEPQKDEKVKAWFTEFKNVMKQAGIDLQNPYSAMQLKILPEKTYADINAAKSLGVRLFSHEGRRFVDPESRKKSLHILEAFDKPALLNAKGESTYDANGFSETKPEKLTELFSSAEKLSDEKIRELYNMYREGRLFVRKYTEETTAHEDGIHFIVPDVDGSCKLTESCSALKNGEASNLSKEMKDYVVEKGAMIGDAIREANRQMEQTVNLTDKRIPDGTDLYNLWPASLNKKTLYTWDDYQKIKSGYEKKKEQEADEDLIDVDEEFRKNRSADDKFDMDMATRANNLKQRQELLEYASHAREKQQNLKTLKNAVLLNEMEPEWFSTEEQTMNQISRLKLFPDTTNERKLSAKERKARDNNYIYHPRAAAIRAKLQKLFRYDDTETMMRDADIRTDSGARLFPAPPKNKTAFWNKIVKTAIEDGKLMINGIHLDISAKNVIKEEEQSERENSLADIQVQPKAEQKPVHDRTTDPDYDKALDFGDDMEMFPFRYDENYRALRNGQTDFSQTRANCIHMLAVKLASDRLDLKEDIADDPTAKEVAAIENQEAFRNAVEPLTTAQMMFLSKSLWNRRTKDPVQGNTFADTLTPYINSLSMCTNFRGSSDIYRAVENHLKDYSELSENMSLRDRAELLADTEKLIDQYLKGKENKEQNDYTQRRMKVMSALKADVGKVRAALQAEMKLSQNDLLLGKVPEEKLTADEKERMIVRYESLLNQTSFSAKTFADYVLATHKWDVTSEEFHRNSERFQNLPAYKMFAEHVKDRNFSLDKLVDCYDSVRDVHERIIKPLKALDAEGTTERQILETLNAVKKVKIRSCSDHQFMEELKNFVSKGLKKECTRLGYQFDAKTKTFVKSAERQLNEMHGGPLMPQD